MLTRTQTHALKRVTCSHAALYMYMGAGHAVLANYIVKTLRVKPSPRALDLALANSRLAIMALLMDAGVDYSQASNRRNSRNQFCPVLVLDIP